MKSLFYSIGWMLFFYACGVITVNQERLTYLIDNFVIFIKTVVS